MTSAALAISELQARYGRPKCPLGPVYDRSIPSFRAWSHMVRDIHTMRRRLRSNGVNCKSDARTMNCMSKDWFIENPGRWNYCANMT